METEESRPGGGGSRTNTKTLDTTVPRDDDKALSRGATPASTQATVSPAEPAHTHGAQPVPQLEPPPDLNLPVVRRLQQSRFKWERTIRGRIPARYLGCALMLATYATGETGRNAHPGENRLAGDLCCTTRSVRSHLAWLDGRGWITRTARGAARRHHADVYALTVPAPVADRLHIWVQHEDQWMEWHTGLIAREWISGAGSLTSRARRPLDRRKADTRSPELNGAVHRNAGSGHHSVDTKQVFHQEVSIVPSGTTASKKRTRAETEDAVWAYLAGEGAEEHFASAVAWAERRGAKNPFAYLLGILDDQPLSLGAMILEWDGDDESEEDL